jgi:acyl carrier protein
MVPSAFVALDAFPLTPNGKVDRKALPPPERARSETAAAYSAPETAVEKAIAEVLRDLLSTERVSVDHNFFDLGANSLMMVQVSARLRAALGKSVPLLHLFRFPTVRALAARIRWRPGGRPAAPAERGAGGGPEERDGKPPRGRRAVGRLQR